MTCLRGRLGRGAARAFVARCGQRWTWWLFWVGPCGGLHGAHCRAEHEGCWVGRWLDCGRQVCGADRRGTDCGGLHGAHCWAEHECCWVGRWRYGGRQICGADRRGTDKGGRCREGGWYVSCLCWRGRQERVTLIGDGGRRSRWRRRWWARGGNGGWRLYLGWGAGRARGGVGGVGGGKGRYEGEGGGGRGGTGQARRRGEMQHANEGKFVGVPGPRSYGKCNVARSTAFRERAGGDADGDTGRCRSRRTRWDKFGGGPAKATLARRGRLEIGGVG